MIQLLYELFLASWLIEPAEIDCNQFGPVNCLH